MGRRAFIVGGTGQIGRATALDLLSAGWEVTVSHRGSNPVPGALLERGAKISVLDRNTPGALATTLGSGADLLIDAMAFDAADARQLVGVEHGVGHFVVISSSSVYRDELDRTLDEAPSNGFPELPDPIPETQPTVDPGPSTYSTRKVALERRLLDEGTVPVTILRPGAIYGVGSSSPREWWFVKRMLDSRSTIPLAYRGSSRFHTTAARNIAALISVIAEKPGRRVLNIADPSAPSVGDIGACIARHLGYQGRIVGVNDPSYPPPVGRTPWSVPRPFVLNCQAALNLGYAPTVTYAEAVGPVCDWLAATAADGDWKGRFPRLAAQPRDHFDYAAEDKFFQSIR
jgi:nucleoside-diphosphate-sugar epimerase